MKPIGAVIIPLMLFAGCSLFRPAEVRLPGTQAYSLRSAYTGERYGIWVSLPEGYDPGERIGAVYLVDADICFASAASILRQMRIEGELPKLALIGISFDESDDRYAARRRKDLTPTECCGFDSVTGRAADFSLFLKKELIPWAEKRFALDPSGRALCGFSYSGLYVLHLMLCDPDLFARRLAASPSLWWDSRIMFGIEQWFAASGRGLSGKLVVSVGENETEARTSFDMAGDAKEFCIALASRRYPGFSLRFLPLPEEAHRSSFPIAFTKGIRFLFTDSVNAPSN